MPASASKHIQKLTMKTLVSSSSDSDSEGPKPGKQPKACHILWNASRTELLLDWLKENPEDRQKLFSDSSKDAKDEGRCKHVAKSSKSEFHRMITAAVFSIDPNPNICVDFCDNPINYTKSVDNYIIW
jgi:hypothetical protein